MRVMARKKKVKRFRAVQAVKELARERMGAPPAEKVVPHRTRRQRNTNLRWGSCWARGIRPRGSRSSAQLRTGEGCRHGEIVFKKNRADRPIGTTGGATATPTSEGRAGGGRSRQHNRAPRSELVAARTGRRATDAGASDGS